MLKRFYQSALMEAGCDEAGRGSLAGPVFAAAVILPADYSHPNLNDSKQLSAKQREKIRCDIEKESVAWAVGRAEAGEIDSVNIINATFLAVHRAIKSLPVVPGFIIMDGNRFLPYRKIPFNCIIKGDSIYFSIAAASVLAKTYRDEYMYVIHKKYPKYEWERNKGYPTASHRRAIESYGISPYHRRSFKLTDTQLKLGLKFI